MARRTVSSSSGSSRTTSRCPRPAVSRNVMARRIWLRTYSARFSGSFSVDGDGRERLEDAAQDRARSTRSSTSRRRTSVSSTSDTGLGTTLRTVAGANCSSSSRRRCTSASPRKSAARARSSVERPLADPGHDARRRAQRRAGTREDLRRHLVEREHDTCAAPSSGRARTRGAGSGNPELGEDPLAQATAIAARALPARASSSGSRSSLTSRLHGTTSGTNAGSRRPRGRARSFGVGSVAARCSSTALLPRARAPDEQQRHADDEERHRRQPGHGREEQHEHRPPPAAPWARRGAAARALRRGACRPPRSRRASPARPRAVDRTSAGICVTRPSPMVSRP